MADPTQAPLWHQRAEQLRKLADGFSDKNAKRDLLNLADRWDRLALRAATNASADEC